MAYVMPTLEILVSEGENEEDEDVIAVFPKFFPYNRIDTSSQPINLDTDTEIPKDIKANLRVRSAQKTGI